MMNLLLKTTKILVITLLLFVSHLCNGQPQHVKIDTLSCLTLKKTNNTQPKTNILHTKYKNDQVSSSQIVIIQENKIINSIRLPITDDEVKNFQITKVKETNKGFSISTNWGGGNNIYDLVFKFEYVDSNFYLSQVIKKHYGPSTKLSIQNIETNILIKDFEIKNYL